MCVFDEFSRILGRKIRAHEDSGTVNERMLSGNLAVFDGDAQRARADAQERCGFREGQPADLVAQFWIVTGEAVSGPQRRHALLGEAVTAAGADVAAIEIAGDLAIGADPRKAAHRLDDVRRRAVGLAAVTARHSQFCMNAAMPVDDQCPSFRSSSRLNGGSGIKVASLTACQSLGP